MRLPEGIRPYYKFFIWVVVIGYLCLAPADGFKKVHIPIPYFDKVIHFGMFFILGELVAVINRNQVSKIVRAYLLAFSVVYGGLIELAQNYLTTSRTGDWVDWLADITGLWLGIWFVKYLPARIIRFLT